jgi:hypothetical protein
MKKSVLQILFLVLCLSVNAQADRLDSLLTDVLGNDRSMNHLLDQVATTSFFYSGISADNKTFYAGREIGNDIYSVNGNIYFFHSTGFYFGASGSWFSQIDPHYGLTAFSAGIRKALNRTNTISSGISYSRYVFNVSDSVYIPYSNNLGAGLYYTRSWFGASVAFNLLFGNEIVINLTPSIYSNFRIARLGKSGKILISPEISGFLGSDLLIQTDNLYEPVSSVYGSPSKYGLLNLKAFVPAGIYFSGFGIEAGYSVNFPLQGSSQTKPSMSSYFSLSLSYVISFK